ncbi:hypothetical protein Dda_6742 [Drechslerella dactyloides]|uniref:DUF726-domain-containing protein n=1 Tax=Drechslerella dactyloides TaxID=74499 RepID=A0AAD6IU38_DREDA|nr:hypothetical protein Dda_6742 [Drechslerella dactyloides]
MNSQSSLEIETSVSTRTHAGILNETRHSEQTAVRPAESREPRIDDMSLQHPPLSTEAAADDAATPASILTPKTVDLPAVTTSASSSGIPVTTPAVAKDEEPELDDFGLPVFKPVPIAIHAESSDGEEDALSERERRDDDASSRTTGSPTREVEGKSEEDRGVSIGERAVERMSLEFSPTVIATASAVATTAGIGIGSRSVPVSEGKPSTVHAAPSPVPTNPPSLKDTIPERETASMPTDDSEPTDSQATLVAVTTPQEPPPKTTEPVPSPANEASKERKSESTTTTTPAPLITSDLPPATAKPIQSPRDPVAVATPTSPTSHHVRNFSQTNKDFPTASPLNPITAVASTPTSDAKPTISSWSHQQSAPADAADADADATGPARRDSGEWQEMPSYAPYDIYDDNGKLVAKEYNNVSEDEGNGEDTLGGASKGYTRVQMDEDAQSATSMDENTGYLWKETEEEDDYSRNPLSQLETTKDLLTEGQRIAYVGLCKLAMMEMRQELEKMGQVKKSWARKSIGIGKEHMKMWSQIVMVRLYKHMDINPDEQIMIEQLSEHGVVASDLTPTLMKNARVKNPMAAESRTSIGSATSPRPTDVGSIKSPTRSRDNSLDKRDSEDGYLYGDQSPPAYDEHMTGELPAVRMPSQLPDSKTLDIDIRWTVLCDLFLVLISDSVYDARSRTLLELVGKHLSISWIDICKFEKKVTDALEMQESAAQNWNESDILEDRAKRARNMRYAMMGLATLGGGLVIGLSAGLLAPVIGAGLAAGFTTIGITSTGAFLGGTGGAALITTTAALSGSAIAGKAAGRRTKNVSVFEFRPLYNNKRVNLIVTISGWMNGKEDDVRLPYSTVDPVMGDIYSVLWEPEMMQSMGQTINILATEVLTQSLQQVLGSTVLMALMASLQVPLILTKLSYLLDNPWNVSLDRAWASGLILADTLMHRNLGVRPVTLVGFSLGARVIYSCLLELAKRNAHGLVQNVYMFGSPVVINQDEFMATSAIVRGRFVNGYCRNDWILGYLFRATSGGIGRVAGLAPIENVPGLENLDCTEFVEGHMAYRTAIPKLLKKVDWEVLSEEFSEIEEADPDQLRERQIELISEIEAARKELEKEPTKRKWGLFGRNKDVAKKADWEVYAEEGQRDAGAGGSVTGGSDAGFRDSLDEKDNVLFDVEAIRRELALQEIEERERAKDKDNKERRGSEITSRPTLARTSATPTGSENGMDSVSVNRSRPATAGKKGSISSTASPSGTTRSSRNFSFGIFGRKDSADKSATQSRNSSVMDLTASGAMSNGAVSPSPEVAKNTGNIRANRGSSGSLEPRSPWAGYSYEDEFGHEEGHVQMTFEDSKWEDKYDYGAAPPPPPPPKQKSGEQKRAASYWGQSAAPTSSLVVRGASPALSSTGASPRVSYDGRNEWSTGAGGGALPVLNKNATGTVPKRTSSLGYHSPTPSAGSGYSGYGHGGKGSVSSASGLGISAASNKPLPKNPWMEEEEDEFGKEGEMTLSFE